jgi:hypothetical protein
MVAVAHEVLIADSVDIDRRHRLSPSLRLVDLLPSEAGPIRGRTETAIEVPRAIDAANDRIEGDGLNAQVSLPNHSPKGVDDFFEGQHDLDVVRLTTQPSS